MPWRASDAKRHSKKATGRAAAVWSKVANRALSAGGSDASAIRRANAVVKRLKGAGGKSS